MRVKVAASLATVQGTFGLLFSARIIGTASKSDAPGFYLVWGVVFMVATAGLLVAGSQLFSYTEGARKRFLVVALYLLAVGLISIPLNGNVVPLLSAVFYVAVLTSKKTKESFQSFNGAIGPE